MHCFVSKINDKNIDQSNDGKKANQQCTGSIHIFWVSQYFLLDLRVLGHKK